MFGINKKFMIDTGSCMNVIDEKTFNSFEQKPFLEKYHIPAYSYASKNPLHILGRFKSEISMNNKIHLINFVVIKNGQCCILSKNSPLDLYLKRFNINAICMKDDIQINYEKYLNKIYPNLFRDGIRDSIESEIEDILREDIIDRITD